MSTGRWHQDITRTQWLVLAGTTLGWGLDGFAGSLYVLVLGPAMNELLPNSGIGTDGAAIGFYGGLTVALFLTGWATGGILFGMLADYFGRTRVLSVGILTYAVFSALAVFAETWWQLGILRFIAGLGSGVEAPVGAALIAESWRNRFRARAGGVMMAGYAAGFFMAAAAYALLGDHGWRAMMLLAGIPALVVWFIRRYVPEPPEIGAHLQARKERKALGRNHDHDRFVLRRLFTPPLLHRAGVHRTGYRSTHLVLERIHLVPADHPADDHRRRPWPSRSRPPGCGGSHALQCRRHHRLCRMGFRR